MCNMNIAIIEKNIVSNIALFDDIETAQEFYPDSDIVNIDSIECYIGWIYDSESKTFKKPDEQLNYQAFIDGLMGVEYNE